MKSPTLQGRSILIVEDEPFITMDLTIALEATGASVTSTNTLKHALLLVEHDGLSAAILDHVLGDGDSSLLYKRLNERGIPFMIYSGFPTIDAETHRALHIQKPASHDVLVAATEELVRRVKNSK